MGRITSKHQTKFISILEIEISDTTMREILAT